MIREEIAKRLHTWERNILKIIYEASPMNVSWSALTEAQREKFRKDADQIPSIKLGNRTLKELIELYEQGKLLEKADNQDLPEIPPEHQRRRGIESVYDDGWRDGFEWLLNMLKDGWVKCKVKEEQHGL